MSSAARDYQEASVLITGGAGCIGSNLTRALVDAGARRIVVLDDLSAAHEWNLPKAPAVEFVKGSVTDDAALEKAFRAAPTVVFHLAAHFANQNSVDHPQQDLLVNGLGTLKVLDFARRAKATRVVNASSGCSVYGAEAPLPVSEEFMSLHLDTPYQITKLLGELYANFFQNFHKLDAVNLRFFNVYGPGEVPGRYRNVIPNFLWWGMHQRPLPITGTGEETRDFTYVTDIVEGVLAAGTRPGAVGEAINLASSVETKVKTIAEIVNTLTKNPAGTKVVPRRDWDRITRRRASIEKARRILGYEPQMKIQDGIRKTHEWLIREAPRIGAIPAV